MSIRIGIAAFMQESNSFAPRLAELQDFDVHDGRDLIDFFTGTNSEIAGFLDGAKDEQWEPVPLVAAIAISGGPLSKTCFEEICGRIIAAIEAQPIDGLLLALHGAMSVEQYPSGDAEIVRRVSQVIGQHIPVTVSHDFHANVTPDLLKYVNGVSGYRTYPHIDQYETGRRACIMLARLLAGEKSHHWYLPIPLLLPPEASSTFQAPLKPVMDRLANEFRDSVGIFATLFCVQPWLDLSKVSSSLVVTQFLSDSNPSSQLRDAAAHLWSIRRDFATDWVSPAYLLDAVQTKAFRPVLVSEAFDSPTAGAAGDHTGLLTCLLGNASTSKSCVYLVDSQAAARAHALGLETEFSGTIGASIDNRYSEPVHVRAQIKYLSDGTFVAKGPVYNGRRFSMGPTAVLKTGEVQVVVASKPVMMIDPELYRSQGIEPADQDMVGIKSPLLFRPAYEAISSEIVHLDMSGPSRGRLEKANFKDINRPIYPVDEFDWTPPMPRRIVP